MWYREAAVGVTETVIF